MNISNPTCVSVTKRIFHAGFSSRKYIIFSLLLFFALLGCTANEYLHIKSNKFSLDAVTVVHVKGQKQFCSGVLVAPTLVLTARHCIQHLGEENPKQASLIRVGFGQKINDEKIRWEEVSKVFVPNVMSYQQIDNLKGKDVALLKLKRSVVEQPMTTRIKSIEISTNAKFKMTGFGEDLKGFIGIKHTENLVAMKSQSNTFSFTGAGCRGDSGGPIVNDRGELIGIVSLGSTIHCMSNKIRYAQLLSPFEDFISQHSDAE